MSDVVFFQRAFPSANMVLLTGPNPILVDSGFGSDAAETIRLLESAAVAPSDLQWLVNTHYHCDHAGGNHHLQTHHGVRIAAFHTEGKLVNRRDRQACSIEWLNQSIEAYTVNQLLYEGDILNTGSREWQVLHTPGHTLGHIAFHSDGELIAGDTVHADDVAWVNFFREGVGAIDRMIATIERLKLLNVRTAYSGHGPITTDPQARFDAALRRYERWLQQPEKIGWHAVKRIFTYALMLFDGLPETHLEAYLLSCPWYLDYCRYVFDSDPVAFIPAFTAELKRSGAAQWRDGVIFPTAPYNAVDPEWLKTLKRPDLW